MAETVLAEVSATAAWLANGKFRLLALRHLPFRPRKRRANQPPMYRAIIVSCRRRSRFFRGFRGIRDGHFISWRSRRVEYLVLFRRCVVGWTGAERTL
jgi:hypothetical protein